VSKAHLTLESCGTTFITMVQAADFRDLNDTLKGQTPIEWPECKGVNFHSYRWQKHCSGLYQTPLAA